MASNIQRKPVIILKRFIAVTIFFGLIITASIITANSAPPSVTYKNGDWDYVFLPDDYNATKWNVLFDPHSHTLYSDGKLTVEQNIQWHISNGYNAIAISDHNTWDHVAEVERIVAEKYADKVVILPASEWTTNVIHMNIIMPPDATGYEDLVPPSRYPTKDEIKQAIKDAHDLGGVVMVNHFNWSIPRMPDHPTRQEIYEWGADFIEINGADWDQESVNFVAGNEMSLMAATDMHGPSGVQGWTALWVEEFTAQAVFDQLKIRNTTVLFQETRTPYLANHTANPAYTALRPLIQIGSIFRSYELSGGALDWTAIMIFMGYYIGFFFVAELGREISDIVRTKYLKKRE